MQWFYAQDGRQIGPLDEATFRDLVQKGEIKPTDYVWHPGMGDQWRPASEVPGLLSPLPAVPPPVSSQREEIRRQSVGATADAEEARRQSAGATADAEETRRESTGTTGTGTITVVSPVEPAWERMKTILFRPFSMGKWFALGFSAWLASFGEGGGGGNFNLPIDQSNAPDMARGMEEAWNFVQTHLALVVVLAVVGVLLLVALGLVLLWLRCRGQFMFLDNVVNDRNLIGEPWCMFRQHGNSLFVWNIVYGLICFLVLALLVTLVVLLIVIPCVRVRGFVSGTIPWIVLLGLFFIAFLVVAGFIGMCRDSFVVPIMYKHDLTAMEAWGRFMGVLRGNFWRFVLFGLFSILLGIIAGVAVIVAGIVTCCIGCCLMMIPYIGAVVTLPVSVFFRAYTLEYFAQYGPEYRLFTEESWQAESSG